MILDTAFLIELLREERGAFDKGAELSENGVPQRIPSPVLYELEYGVGMFGDDDERRAVPAKQGSTISSHSVWR